MTDAGKDGYDKPPSVTEELLTELLTLAIATAPRKWTWRDYASKSRGQLDIEAVARTVLIELHIRGYEVVKERG
jgi:hypothetical protein